MKSLLIATHNPGKLREMIEVLKVLPLQIFSLKDLKITEDVHETGRTHEENALLKARFFAKLSGMPTLGEDAGIYVDAFPGELGVFTRRWEGLHKASDEDWIAHFLKRMNGVTDRRARFVSVAAIIIGDVEKVFFGETEGTITDKLEAPLLPGIPISSCFRPGGSRKVYAALTEKEKNAISHRGKAMHQIVDYLGAR